MESPKRSRRTSHPARPLEVCALRYLHPSALALVRHRAAERLSRRRCRSSRVRLYVSHPAGDLAPLALAVRLLLDRGAAA